MKQWDEFQWERELRQHESRVASYFRELVYCIDLPVEEAVFDLPGGAGDPVSAPMPHNPALQEWLRNHDDDEDTPECTADRHSVCFAPVDALDQLCVSWNIICASRLRCDLMPQGMGINCAFGKLLARCADFTEPVKDIAPALLLTLGKRSLADLKELCSMLENIGSLQPSLKDECDSITARLLIVREQLLAKLNELRSSR